MTMTDFRLMRGHRWWPYSEGDLLGFGFALEVATAARTAPQYRTTLTP